MTPRTSAPNNVTAECREDFSLVIGGPLFQLLCRTRLSDDALMLVKRRILVISLLAWLPLLLLSAWEGNALGGSLALPFLLDVEAHIRFLVAIPLLIAAELVVHRRIRPVVQGFLERDLIPAEDFDRFNAAIEASYRLRNSVIAELLLIAIVYGVGVLIVWQQYMSLDAATWYSNPSSSGSRLSMAGMWYGYVSVPIFQFLLLRWLFRIFIWARFLWLVSRIRLRVLPTHPDRVGGIGFLSDSINAFAVLALALSSVLAGQLANRIFYVGATLTEFSLEIAVAFAFLLFIVLGPLMFFSGQLAEARRVGLHEYGKLAQRYVRELDTKWLRGNISDDEPIVGSADIQSFADLGNSFEVVQAMRSVPITIEAIIQLAVAILIPVAPLVLTMMPLEVLAEKVVSLLF